MCVTEWALLVKVCAPAWISIVNDMNNNRVDNLQGRCIRVNKTLTELNELRPCTEGEWFVCACVSTCVHAHVE